MIDLETRVGVRLCRRGRAGFALTEEGHEIYRTAKELLRQCDKFVGRVKNITGDITGELSVATADALLENSDFHYAELISELRAEMPSVSLHLRVMEPLEIEQAVLEQKLHVGIHTFPNHAPGLRYLKLFDEVQDLYCGSGHPLFDRDEPPERDEIESFEYASRSYYGGTLRPGTIRPSSITMYSGNMEAIAAAILSGKFLGHLPLQSARPYLEAGLIRPIQPELYSYRSGFEAVFPAGARLSRAQKKIEELLRQRYNPVSDTPGRPRKNGQASP